MDNEVYNNPTSHLIDYLASQGVMMQEDPFIPKGSELKAVDEENNNNNENNTDNIENKDIVNQNVNGVNQNVNNNSNVEIVEI